MLTLEAELETWLSGWVINVVWDASIQKMVKSKTSEWAFPGLTEDELKTLRMSQCHGD